MTMFVEEDDSEIVDWFKDKTKLEKYIKKVTRFANHTIKDYESEIKRIFHEKDHEIKYTRTYRDLMSQKCAIIIDDGFIFYNSDSFASLSRMKSKLSISDTLIFVLPKSDEDIQIAKELMVMKYSSLEPINRKLSWAINYPYINVDFHKKSLSDGNDIKIKFTIDEVQNTKEIANQIYQICGDEVKFSKQFLNFAEDIDYKAKNVPVNNKSFTAYCNDLSFMDNLFFICKKKQLSINKIEFFHNKKTNSFSEYIKSLTEIQ
jgi:hypothetical protein